ncbi:NADH-quinone oxidoreductase subunit M [bacterium]|nr:NADH-quinone oxidoreductase subunit M [bacterium]
MTSLSAMILLPLLGALFCYQTRDRNAVATARVVALLSLLQSLWALVDGPRQPFSQPWLPQLGINFDLALHPAGLAMLVLTPLLTWGALGLTRPGLERRSEYCGHLLMLLAGLQGLFLADNLGLFYVFFELILLPTLLLVARWGGERGRAAALKFFLYTLMGSLPMLLGILALGFQTGGNGLAFGQLAHLPEELQQSLFWLFALAFLVKLPVFPLHGWQIDLYRTAPAPVAAVVAGAMSKAGAYGLLRVLVGIFPEATAHFAPVVAGLALISILHGGVSALGAPCLRGVLAYSSLSHLGLLSLAVVSGTGSGQSGAILQMFSHGICTGGLFLVVAALENRGFSTEIKHLSGLARSTPQLAALALVLTMGSLGCPGLCSFPAELSMLLGIYTASPGLALLASAGVVLAAWYGLRFYQGTFNGPAQDGLRHADLNESEWVAMLPLVLLCFGVGLFPDLTILQWTRALL